MTDTPEDQPTNPYLQEASEALRMTRLVAPQERVPWTLEHVEMLLDLMDEDARGIVGLADPTMNLRELARVQVFAGIARRAARQATASFERATARAEDLPPYVVHDIHYDLMLQAVAAVAAFDSFRIEQALPDDPIAAELVAAARSLSAPNVDLADDDAILDLTDPQVLASDPDFAQATSRIQASQKGLQGSDYDLAWGYGAAEALRRGRAGEG